VDVCFVIQQRLKELGLEQRDLAGATQVTESYISQLLTRKKAPPAAERTDLYDKMNAFLKLPEGQLASLVQEQQREELKKKIAAPPAPLFQEVRELILKKCNGRTRTQVREIFAKQAFGELERLVSQTVLDVAKGVARDELKNEGWLRKIAKLQQRSYEEMRALSMEFLTTDVFNVSSDHCLAFLDPMIDSWDIELKSFAITVVLNKRLAVKKSLKFNFVETGELYSSELQPGFQEFLRSAAMSGDATADELSFLKSLQFRRARPSALYYYRELQSLRDLLHFPRETNPAFPRRPKGRRIPAK
jgi:transcriptional regulator with XRE-family HTH domain